MIIIYETIFNGILKSNRSDCQPGYKVEDGVGPDKASWVHKWACVTSQFAIIISSIENTLHLLHVCHPVDLCVFHPFYHHRVEEQFSRKKNNGSQPAVARIAQKPLGV